MSSREISLNTSDEKDTFYSWLVVFWLFIANCIEDGLFKAFGVALITLSDNYGVHVWVVGSTVSMVLFFGSATGENQYFCLEKVGTYLNMLKRLSTSYDNNL